MFTDPSFNSFVSARCRPERGDKIKGVVGRRDASQHRQGEDDGKHEETAAKQQWAVDWLGCYGLHTCMFIDSDAAKSKVLKGIGDRRQCPLPERLESRKR